MVYPVNAVHVDTVLTNVSVKYVNGNFASEELFPVQNVKKQSDRYRIYGLDNWKAENDLRSPGGVANELPPAVLSDVPYYASEHALTQPIPKEARDNNDGFNLDVAATETVTDKILLGREIAAYNIAGTSGNYAAGLSLAMTNANSFANTTVDPRLVIKAARKAVYKRILRWPNTLIIGNEGWESLVNHPMLANLIKSGIAVATEQVVKNILNIPKIVVPGLATFVGGTSGSPYNFMWDNTAVLAYVDKKADAPTFGREFNWGYPSPMLVDRWNEPQRKSDLIRASRRYDLKPVGVETISGHADNGKIIAGYLFTNINA